MCSCQTSKVAMLLPSELYKSYERRQALWKNSVVALTLKLRNATYEATRSSVWKRVWPARLTNAVCIETTHTWGHSIHKALLTVMTWDRALKVKELPEWYTLLFHCSLFLCIHNNSDVINTSESNGLLWGIHQCLSQACQMFVAPPQPWCW